MKPHPKRVIVVGSGSIARRHISNLRQLYPAAVVGCVSASGRRLRTEETDATELFTDLCSALESSVDFAIVASPASLHLDHSNKLLRHGIPVLIEKPLCITASEFNAVGLDAGKNKVQVAYNLRYLTATQKVKKILDQQLLGTPITAFAEVGQYLPDWRPGEDYRRGVSARRELGGGALLELSHELDYLLWFFGQFDYVSGVVRHSSTLEIDVEDSVDALLEHHSKLLVHLHLDFLQRQARRTFRVIGTEATLLWDLLRNKVELLMSKGVTQVVHDQPNADRNGMYLEQIQSFWGFLQGNQSVGASLDSASQVMTLIQAIRASSKDGEKVRIERNSA